MARVKSFFAFLMLLPLITVCTPQVTTAPQSAPTKPQANPPAAPISSLPLPTSEDGAWARVVEAAKREGAVTAYSYSLTGDIANAIIEAFRNKYGIRLEVVGGVGAVLAERIKTENAAKKYVADTFDTGVTAILPIKELRILANISDLPVLKEKDVWSVSPVLDTADGTMLLVRPTYQAPVINTTLVKSADEPKSYLDFLDPRWKGKKLVIAPPRISWPLVYLHVMRPDVINEEFLRALAKQDLMVVSTMRDEPTAVARGEALAAVSTSLGVAGPIVQSGAPLKALTMKEGNIVATTAVSVLKNSPHPNAARVFVNWWLSAEGQTVHNKAMGGFSGRNDVPDYSPEPIRIKPIKFLPLDEKANKLSAKYVAEGRVDKYLGVDIK